MDPGFLGTLTPKKLPIQAKGMDLFLLEERDTNRTRLRPLPKALNFKSPRYGVKSFEMYRLKNPTNLKYPILADSDQ